jgi:hypothetical protein
MQTNHNNIMRKKISILIIIVLLLIIGFLLFRNNKVISPTITEEQKNPVSLCYYYLNKTDNGLYDKSWLRLDITNGVNVSGEFDSYPAEKDSKVGTFSGTAGLLNQNTMGRTAELWWNSLAEGMQVKEELNVEFGDGSASALYGEMVDRGDGVYVYKDKTALSFGPSLSQIDCEAFNTTLATFKKTL